MGSMTARIPITIRRGQSFSVSDTARDSAGNAIPLTGYAGRGQVKDKIGGTLLVTFTVVVTDPAAGDYRFEATDAATAAVALSYATGEYDIELYNDANVITTRDGPVKFTGEVTT